MTAAEILSQLQAAGIGIRLHGDTLLCRPLGNVPAELAEQIRAHKPELVALLAEPAPAQTAPPVCPRCRQQDYMPLADGWRRCWSCGWRWGPAGTKDPGDSPDLIRTASLIGLAAQPRIWLSGELASSSPEAAAYEATPDYPAGILCRRDGCRGLGWNRDQETGGWRCRACGGPLPKTRESLA
jgi:hypothetical protein